MGRDTTLQPTNAELRILRILWKNGPSTVRHVFEELEGESGYTTVLKMMQIMLEKGLLTRNETDRSHVYAAAAPEARAKKSLVQDLMQKAFEGSAKDLILQALSTKKASREELAEIRRMIEEMEKRK
jgi:BlaI family penicillinase repressor